MIKGKTISVVIPCKNEEKVIAAAIKNIPSYVDEILVIDNGSTDNTSQAALQAGATVIKEDRKLDGIGYGYAHLTGLANATGDFVFASDGDDTYPVKEIKKIVAFMEKNKLDVVSCNRLPLKTPGVISKTRQLGIWVLNIETFLLYGKPIKDILTGMWGIRRSSLLYMTLKMGDWNLSPEIKIEAITNPKIAFSEYHIDHFHREKEPSKQQIWKTGMNHLLYILKRRVVQDSKVYAFAVKTYGHMLWRLSKLGSTFLR